MKIFRYFACLFLLIGLSTNLFAQDKKLNGTVYDENKEPLIGATVLLMGADDSQINATITNIDGAYSFSNVPTQATQVQFSFIGYENETIVLNGQATINVEMKSSFVNLDAVVVTALGIKREEKALGYSVGTVDNAAIENESAVSPIEALQGKVAGLNVSTSGSGPGGSSNITIRGLASITGNNQPLFVIDGVPINSGGGSSGTEYGGFDYGNAANTISPDDIESYSVLKGGAATALYGSRGANGVIMITTKKGSKRKGIGISLQSSVEFSNPYITPKFQNDYAQGSSGKYVANDFKSWGPKMEGQTVSNFLGQEQVLNTQSENYFNEFYNTALNINNSLTLNKRNEKNGIYFSANWLDYAGVLPDNNFDRKSITARFDSKLADFIKFETKANYIIQDADNRPVLSGSPDNPVYVFTTMPRSISLDQLSTYETVTGEPVVYTQNYMVNADGTIAPNGSLSYAASPLMQNPYWTVHKNLNHDLTNRLIAFGEFEFDFENLFSLPFELKLRTRMSMDFMQSDRKKYTAEKTFYKIGGLATLSNAMSKNQEVNAKAELTFSKDILDFSVNAIIGTNRRQSTGISLATNSESGLINPYGTYVIQNMNNPVSSEGEWMLETQSVYGLISTDYKNMVYLDFTARNDWVSNLSSENWSFLYPSVSASWLIHESFTLPNIINFLKVRGSYAITGNSGSVTGSMRNFVYTTNPNQYYGLPYGNMSNTRPDPDINAEYSHIKEFGIQSYLYHNRFEIDLSVFQSGTPEQIMTATLAQSSGFNNGWINAGLIENSGVEILVNAKVIDRDDWSLALGANYTRQWAELKDLPKGKDRQDIGGAAGIVITAKEGYAPGIMLGSVYDKDANGNLILDSENMPKYKTTEGGAMDKEQIIGNYMPHTLWGVNLTTTYKEFFFSAGIDSKLGHDIYSLTDRIGAQYGTLDYTTEGRDEWEKAKELAIITSTEPNNGYMVSGVKEILDDEGNPTGTYTSVSAYPVDPQKYWDRLAKIDEAFVYDASYIRLRNISVGYNTSINKDSKLPFESMKVSAYINNVAYLMKKTENISPESSFGTGNVRGIEMYAQPELRNIGLKVKLTF